jgi:hypothetical protein
MKDVLWRGLAWFFQICYPITFAKVNILLHVPKYCHCDGVPVCFDVDGSKGEPDFNGWSPSGGLRVPEIYNRKDSSGCPQAKVCCIMGAEDVTNWRANVAIPKKWLS